MATFTERLELLIDAKTGGAISGLKAVSAETKTMGVEQTKATGITGRMEAGLGKLGISSEAAGMALKAGVVAGAAAAGYAMLKFAKDSVSATVEVESSVLALQRATGATAETSSKLIAITDDYGISAEAATKSFAKLSVNIANHKQALADDGIEIVKNRAGQIDFEKTLLNVADAYEKSGGGAEGLKIATDAFGKTGKDLIPILEKGRAGIKAMFDAVPDKQIFGQKDLANAEDYKLAMDNLNDAVHELQYTLGKALIPILTDVANTLATVTRTAVGADDAIKGLTGVSAIESFGKSLTLGFSLVGSLGDALGLGAKQHNEYADAAQKSAEANKKVADLATAGKKGTEEYRDAQKEARNAADELGGAQRRVASAMEDTVPAADKAKSKIEEAAKANMELLDATTANANAQLGLEGALLNVESALAAADKTNADATATDLDRREAQLRLEQSVLAVAAAAATQYSSQVKLAGGTENAYDKAQAQIAALEDLKRKFPQLEGPINDHIWELGKIPNDKTTTAHFDDNEARWRMANYSWQLDQLPSSVRTSIFADIFGGVPPHGASGALVSRPTLALIGEAGPEAVIPLNRMPGARPVPDMSGTGAGDGGGALTVNLVLDGRVLGQASVDFINRQASRGPGPLVSNATAA